MTLNVFKVGDRVRCQSFSGNGVRRGFNEDKYVRYYGPGQVVLEIINRETGVAREASIDREWFDNNYEREPEVFLYGKNYKMVGVESLIYRCIFSNEDVGLLHAEDLGNDDKWYEVVSHRERTGYAEAS